MPAQSTPSASAIPSAVNIEMSHSGVGSPHMGSWVPKVTVLDPPSQPTTLWGGSTVPVEFEIPNTVGKITDAVLMIEVTQVVASAAAFGAGTIPPTTHWVESVEVFLGSQMVERVMADDLMHETLCFLGDQELNSIAPLVNVTTSGAYRTDGINIATATTAVNTKFRYFLPLWANALITAQPWCKGFQSKWKFRINFAADLYNSSATGAAAKITTSSFITISQVKLNIQEAALSPNEERQLEGLHTNGKIEYRSIRRNKHLSAPSKDLSARATTDQLEVLTEFRDSDSAALIVYGRPSGGAYNSYPNTSRVKFYEIQVTDAQGNPILPRVSGDYIEGFINPWAVSTSLSQSSSTTNLYIVPFCSNLQRVLETGEALGGYRLTGNEKLLFLQDTNASLSACQVHVLSYEYMRIIVQNKASTLVYGA